MKKLFHLLIAGVLVLSVAGCGKSETSRTRNVLPAAGAPRVSPGALRNLVSTKGMVSGAVMGMAMNALTLIPGMPKELSALFGDDGKSEEILAAIAAIEAHLVKIDEKLAEIQKEVKTVQSGVDATIGLINSVINQINCSEARAKRDLLVGLTTAVDSQWQKLFGDKLNDGILKGIMTRIKKDANNDALGNGEFTFTASETLALNAAQEILKGDKIGTAVETLGAILLSTSTSPGLIVLAQSCDTKRFLTSSDSDVNFALITGFQIWLEKVATLQVWSGAYGKTSFPVVDVNTTLVEFENLYSKLDVMKAMRIPAGQVLDKETNKMWARGQDNVRLVQAMNGCPDASVDNTYQSMNPSGEAINESLQCLTSTAIDMPMTDETEWRLPAIYEMSQPATTNVGWQGKKGFPDSPSKATDALFRNWKSGCGATRKSTCVNVANFLTDNGASELVSNATLTQVVGTALVDAHSMDGLIWSSTSMAAAASDSSPSPRATTSDSAATSNSNIVRENDKSLTTPRNAYRREFTDTNSAGNDRGLSKKHLFSIRTGDTHSSNYTAHNDPPCNAIYGPNEQRIAGGTYRANCSAHLTSDLCHGGMQSGGNTVPRGTSFTYGDTPIPHTLASVRTANLAATRQEDEQVHAIASASLWGGSIDCTDTKVVTPGQFDFTFSNKMSYTQLYLSVSFPEYARTLYVRNLKPNEFYTFKDESGYDISSDKINEVVSATIGVFGVRGEFNVQAIGEEARCTLDPATAPTNFNTFLKDDPSCGFSYSTKSLKPGKHVVYAMAKSASNQFTQLVRKEITFEGTPPPKPEFTVTAKTNEIDVKLTAPGNPDYEYEATASDGTNKKTCKILQGACTIGNLVNNEPYGVTIKTSWGEQVSVSEDKPTMTFFSPPAFNCTVLAEDKKVTLNCSSPTNTGVRFQTPVDKYVVKNGSAIPVDCLPNTNCIINNLQNHVDTNLEVVATNNFGTTSQFPMVRSIGKPEKPTDVVVSGSDGKIYVSWEPARDGDAAAKYVATATNGSVNYSCISKQTMNAGIMTSSAPKLCVITVPRTNSNLSYAVAVKGGNGNCSDSSTTCNYSESVEAGTTISPQFNPDRPTLVATVENSKITVTATPAAEGGLTNKITIASNPTASDPTRLSCDATAPNWTCVFNTFTRDQIYTFTGTGYNASTASGVPGMSNAVKVYTAPTAPVISQTTTFDGKILVTIGSSTDVIDSYTVTAADANKRTFTCQISKPNRSCEVTGLQNLTKYSVSATAQNNGGVSASSALVPGLMPFGVPDQGIQPTVKLDTAGGSAVFHVNIVQPDGEDITKYEVRMVAANKNCTILFPGLTCDIEVDDRFIGSSLRFTFTATNRIGESQPSPLSEAVKYERAPLAPQDVILTPDFPNLNVHVLADADSSTATKFVVTATPGNYSCSAGANGICVLRGVARGKAYTITMKAINDGGTSPASSRLYYLTAPPGAPQDLTTSASSAGLVVELGAGKIPTDTDSMLITATPSLGGDSLSCKIILPAKTCAIKSDPTKTYKISAVGESTTKTYKISAVGESTISKETSASTPFTSTDVVKSIAVETQDLVAPVATGSQIEVTAPRQINKTINLGKKSTSKIKIDTVYSAFIKSLPLSAGKVSLLKFSGKVKSDSKKICQTKGSDVILLKKGVCNISAKFKVIENKKSKTVELPAKITVR